ncbi:MAG: biopolymer transporter ExbD [Bacteroidota bacterium]
MAKSRTRDRMKNEINAGSMADIAFLLLIFFLVTTEIVDDKGLRVNLPPWSDEPPPELEFAKNNVYSILVNSNNQLLVDGELMEVARLRQGVVDFITNNGRNPAWSDNPQDAIVSIQNDRGTNYETYIEVYNEVRGAYNELWERAARDRFNVGYEPNAMTREQTDYLKKTFPINLSEAEPTAFGDEG